MTNLSQITHVRPHFLNDRGCRQLWFKRVAHRHCKLLNKRHGFCRVKSEELLSWRFHVGLWIDRPLVCWLIGWLDAKWRQPLLSASARQSVMLLRTPFRTPAPHAVATQCNP